MTPPYKMTLMTAMLFAALSITGAAVAAPPDSAPAKSATKKAVNAVPPPTAQEIADAKAKGLVWVNTNTKVYHSGGDFYGKTKHGKFMTESDAKTAGFTAAQEPGGKKKASTDTKNK
jgi:hypothetical protein